MSRRDVEERLLSYLREHPGSSPREIADALGESLTVVRVILNRLRDRGVVARGEEGRYYVVASTVHGVGRSDVRRHVSYVMQSADLDAIVLKLRELEERVERLEEELDKIRRRLEKKEQ